MDHEWTTATHMTKDEANAKLAEARRLVAEVHRDAGDVSVDDFAELALREDMDQAGRAIHRAIGRFDA